MFVNAMRFNAGLFTLLLKKSHRNKFSKIKFWQLWLNARMILDLKELYSMWEDFKSSAYLKP